MEMMRTEGNINLATLDAVTLAALMAKRIAPHAAQYDRENRFASESIQLLQQSGYAALTVPQAYGGRGVGLYELVRAQERLAMGDGAVALSIGMSLIKIIGQVAKPTWPKPIYEKVMRAAVERGALVNSVASEPKLGSPSRGGKPETIAVPDGQGGWYITGHKTFASLAPILDFIIVTATLQDGSEAVGRFMIERGEGVIVKETWDSLGMRSTGSHDMLFERAYVAPEGLLSLTGGGGEAPSSPPSQKVPTQSPYFSLPVAAAYLGVAAEAHQAAVRFAAKRVPPALGYALTKVGSIRDKLAENERELRAARIMLYTTAQRVEADPTLQDDELKLDIYVAKHTITNNAISVVDRAMRIVGGFALASGGVLERAYRNVRAGLLHPPADDITSRVLAAWTIEANA